MADFSVQSLLEQAINSRTKLHILLVFYENTRMEATPSNIVERTCRDMWSVKQALQEMAEDGILVISQSIGGELAYRYMPRTEYIEPIRRLMRSYDDPLERDTVFRSVREISEYAVPGYPVQGYMSEQRYRMAPVF